MTTTELIAVIAVATAFAIGILLHILELREKEGWSGAIVTILKNIIKYTSLLLFAFFFLLFAVFSFLLPLYIFFDILELDILEISSNPWVVILVVILVVIVIAMLIFWLYAGIALYEKMKLIKYDRAIKLNPDDASLYYMRALARGKLDTMFSGRKMIKDLDRAIELSPDDASLYNMRALTRGKLDTMFSDKKMMKVMEDLDWAIELCPDDPVLYYNRGSYKGFGLEAQRDFLWARKLAREQGNEELIREIDRELSTYQSR